MRVFRGVDARLLGTRSTFRIGLSIGWGLEQEFAKDVRDSERPAMDALEKRL